MSGETSNPPPNIIPEGLRWKEPAPRPVSEVERAATEEHLQNLAAMGEAVIGSGAVDVAAEMGRLGLKTGTQLAEEKARAERDAEIAAREGRERGEARQHNIDVDTRQFLEETGQRTDRSLDSLRRTIQKGMKKLR